MFHIFGALAEFEREVIRSRTLEGLAADPDRPIADVCRAMWVSKATLYRYVRRRAPTCPLGADARSSAAGGWAVANALRRHR